MIGRRNRSVFQSWEHALGLADFLARATGHRHRVETISPSSRWPRHQWRVVKLDDLTPDAAFDALMDDGVDLVLSGPGSVRVI